MKIAYLGIKGLPSKGGAERVVEGIVNQLVNKHELTVYCGDYYTPPHTQISGIRLIRVPTLPGKYLRAPSMFISSLIHALFCGDYDVVHIHNAEACFISPILRLRYPVIATSHGKAYQREKWSRLAKFLMQIIDLFFIYFSNILTSVSLPLAQEYQKQYKRQIFYIPNGVESTPVVDDRAALITLHKNGINKKYILFATDRLDPTKGCHLFLQAWRSVKRRDLQAVVIANYSTLPSYTRILFDMADERVKFIPFIQSKPELMGIIKRAWLFVFPSTVEAMSMILLEAASLGTSIICSDIPANISVLSEYALFFRSGDSNDLSEKLHWAITHPTEMRNLGEKAKEWVTIKFSWNVIAEKYNHLYQIFGNKRQIG